MAGVGIWVYYTYKVLPDMNVNVPTTVYSKPYSAGATSNASSVTTNDITQKIEICKQLYPNRVYASKKIGQDSCIVTKISGNSALGQIFMVADTDGSGPGAVWIASKMNNKWTIIYEGQDSPLCSTLTKYNVPRDLFDSGMECYTETNQLKKY